MDCYQKQIQILNQKLINSMKAQKSRSQFMKSSLTSEILKKEMTIQKQAAKKYEKFKKSASQPAYFLNKSRLKKISDIYRAISLQKLQKNTSFNKSKSLHTSLTPQKKLSLMNTSTKKPQCYNTLNLNKLLDPNNNTQKTKRLRLNKTNENQKQQSSVEMIRQNANKFLIGHLQKLEQITNLTIEKAFVGQYDLFFRSLKEECFSRKGHNAEMKVLVSKFCYLMELCQQRLIRINEKELKAKYSKVEIDFSNTYTQLKKKSFKMELLIKQIDQLKQHNLKIAKQLNDLKEKNKMIQTYSSNSEKKINISNRKKLQITQLFQVTVKQNQSQITTPVYQHNFGNDNQSQNLSSATQQIYLQPTKNTGNNFQGSHDNGHKYSSQKGILPNYQNQQIKVNQRLEMIKKIRNLEKKQRQLIKTLMVLKSDGIDVQKAFNEVINGQSQQLQQQSFHFKKYHTPRQIKNLKNKDSYEADDSIIDSIDALTARYFQGQPDEEYCMYPIKHEYISKPLDEQLQNKLKLNFDILYEQYEDAAGQGESSEEEEQEGQEEVPTI